MKIVYKFNPEKIVKKFNAYISFGGGEGINEVYYLEKGQPEKELLKKIEEEHGVFLKRVSVYTLKGGGDWRIDSIDSYDFEYAYYYN